jgi:DNA-binding transcriptional ArsR family regulator
MAAVLAAVGEPNRLLLLRLLLDEERCVTQCVEHTGLVQSLVSKHLARLIDVGLVQRRPSGRRNYHSVVDPDGLREILDVAARLAQRHRAD